MEHTMNKVLKILLPILLAICVIVSAGWYLFVYDRDFTRDMLVTCARHSESGGHHNLATWFYNLAYAQSGNSDLVAIELAEQYRSGGNYTKAEFTLSNAISDGGGVEVYIALCKLYVEQDKLLDAVNMLSNITDPEIKAQIEALRPQAPEAMPAPGFYSQYISVTLTSEGGTIYASIDGQYPTVSSPAYEQPLALKDGENNIYAVSIGENGLVSPVSIYGYTVGGVVEKMQFADAAMEAAIRAALGVNESKELFTNDLWTIKTFTVPEEAMVYDDLKHMIFLEELTLENGTAGQLSFLSSMGSLTKLTIKNTAVSQEELKIIGGLPALKELTLHKAELAGIAPLETSTGMTKLDISENTIISIAAISHRKALVELDISGNAITDLTPVASAAKLETLNASSNTVATLAPITGLTALTRLDAGTNKLTDLGQIGSLTKLTYLALGSNQLTTVGSIGSCTELTELDISSNQLTDITSLSSLTKLMYFNFSHNQVEKLPRFTSESAIVTINGSYNKLSSLEPLGVLQQVNTINMSYNEAITSVDCLKNCPVLMIVDVYATKVTEVTSLTNQSIKVYFNPVQD